MAVRTVAQQRADHGRRKYATRQEAKRARSRRQRERRGFDPLTREQKDARRGEHRERLNRALAEVAELEGFARFIESRLLNPQLTAGNVALVASQLPGQVVGAFAHWKGEGSPVRKGQSSSAWITGRGFWPRAVWGHGEVDHPLELIVGAEDPPMPNRAEVERLHADFLASVAAGTRTLDALEAVPEAEVDADDPFTFPEPVSDPIPF